MSTKKTLLSIAGLVAVGTFVMTTSVNKTDLADDLLKANVEALAQDDEDTPPPSPVRWLLKPSGKDCTIIIDSVKHNGEWYDCVSNFAGGDYCVGGCII